MPIPVLPLVLGAAGAAVLFAGSKEAKPATPPSGARAGDMATPTTVTTGGGGGGAMAPSHADYVNTSQEPAQVDGAPAPGVNPTAPSSYTGGVGSVRYGTEAEVAAGESQYQLPEASVDTWQPIEGSSFDAAKVQSYKSTTTGLTGATGVATDYAILSGKAAADAFATVGEYTGWIW